MSTTPKAEVQGKFILPESLRQRALALSEPDGRTYTMWLLLHLFLWAGGIALVVALEGQFGWQLLVAVALGSQLHTLTVLQHECGHRSAYHSTAANRWVGRLLAWFIFMPFTTFTELHRFHHGFLGDKTLDPDEWFYEGGSKQLFFREMLFMPRFIFLSLTKPHIRPEIKRTIWFELLGNAAVFLILIGSLIAIDRMDVLFFGFLIPMLLLAVVFNPISRGYEHYPMACLAESDPRRTDLRHNTITVTSPLVGFLWANITYHVEHHMFPRAPFYRLPALHQLFQNEDYRRSPFPLMDLREVRRAAVVSELKPNGL